VVFELMRNHLLFPHSVGYSQGVEKVTQRLNSFMEGKLLLVLDEVSARLPDGTYDDKVTETLKSIITQLVAGVERKFHETQQAVIPCRLVVLTNHAAPLPVPPEDRRWCCLELSGLLLKDSSRRDRLVAACTADGPRTALHLYHYLMRVEVGDLGREAPPRTAWRANLEYAFQDPVAKFMQHIIEDDDLPAAELSDAMLRQKWEGFRHAQHGLTVKLQWPTVKADIASYCGILAQFRTLSCDHEHKARYRRNMEAEKVWYHAFCDSGPGPVLPIADMSMSATPASFQVTPASQTQPSASEDQLEVPIRVVSSELSEQTLAIVRHLLSDHDDSPAWAAWAHSDSLRIRLEREFQVSPERPPAGMTASQLAQFLVSLVYQKDLYEAAAPIVHRVPVGFIRGYASAAGLNCLVRSALQLLTECPCTDASKPQQLERCTEIRARGVQLKRLPAQGFLDASKHLRFVSDAIMPGADVSWIIHSGRDGDLEQRIGPRTSEVVLHLYNPVGVHFEPLWPAQPHRSVASETTGGDQEGDFVSEDPPPAKRGRPSSQGRASPGWHRDWSSADPQSKARFELWCAGPRSSRGAAVAGRSVEGCVRSPGTPGCSSNNPCKDCAKAYRDFKCKVSKSQPAETA